MIRIKKKHRRHSLTNLRRVTYNSFCDKPHGSIFILPLRRER